MQCEGFVRCAANQEERGTPTIHIPSHTDLCCSPHHHCVQFNNEWNGSACFMVIAALRCAHEAASKAPPAAPSNTDDTTKATAIAVAIASDEAKPSKKQQKEEWTLEGSWKEHFWNSNLEITISADGSLSGVYKSGQGFLTGTLARDGKQATCRWRETAASYGDHVERSGPFLPSLSADGQSFEAEWSQDTPPAGMPDAPWVCSRRKT